MEGTQGVGWFIKFAFALMALASGTAHAQTGDATVDSWLAPFAMKGGNSSAPVNLDPINYVAGQYELCNSPGANSWEQNCPSDLFYTPIAGTSGFQAYGAGITHWFEELGATLYCWIEVRWVEGQPFYEEVCDIIWTYYPEQTAGVVGAKIRFGTMTYWTPWGQQPLSTLAFKANNLFVPYVPSADCVIIFNGTSAPCTSQDATSVGNPGYEDKVIVADENCQRIVRLDDAGDATDGCFYWYGWNSSLPGAYRDTTLFDPANEYRAGVGSAWPLLIYEGVDYYWRIYFYDVYHGESPLPHGIDHRAAVTTDTLGGCPPSAATLCRFNFDQTRIAPIASIQ